MSIIGIGTDIIEIKRIAQLAKKQKQFLSKVFTDEEIAYCSKKKNQWQHFAVRFAAKEAVWKALGRDDIWFKDITVVNSSTGKPEVKIAKGKRKYKIHLSLSHCNEYAIAYAIVEK